LYGDEDGPHAALAERALDPEFPCDQRSFHPASARASCVIGGQLSPPSATPGSRGRDCVSVADVAPASARR
jgi:hypothetical protein